MAIKYFKNVNPCFIKVHHILAVSYKHFMFIEGNDNKLMCVYISDSIYNYLKCIGVPTSQYIRYHKEYKDGI